MAILAPRYEARCSISDSTPPSEVARSISGLAPQRRSRRAAAAHADRQHAAEAALHLPRGQLVARDGRQAGIEHLGDARMIGEALGQIQRVAPPRRARADRGCACRGSAGTPRSGP